MFKKLLIKLLIWLLNWLGINTQNRGIKVMYVVKADHPAVGFKFEFDAFDSEGNVVSEEDLIVSVETDNEEVVDIVFNEDTMSGTASFGVPGLANVNATVEDLEGNLLGSLGAQFTVTVGDPASISAGKLVFEGLAEAVEEPAPVVTEQAVEEEEVPVV
jgi:hypothetical protein